MNPPSLPKATIERAREWADRPPRLESSEAIERAARQPREAQSRGTGTRGWLVAAGAACALVLALVVRQSAPPAETPSKSPAPARHEPGAIEPSGSSTMVIELSSGTRLYVALRRT